MTASERTRRVDAAASLLNIAELLDRKPAQLSGGQQQRVALGRALVREPRVFLMDEPLSNLDVALRTHMRAEIKRIHRTVGATTLFVTHDQAEALGMADRIAVLAGGELQQLATPDEVYNRPANRLVARFMGSPPMNLLDAYSTGEELITKCGWKLPLPIGARALPLRNVTVGIRPEMIRIATDSSPWASPAYISLTEPLGAEVIVHAQVGESIILVRTSPEQRVHAGERLYLTAEEVGMRLFDGSSGQRVY
jgi:ABC-type sugar transport system ATPase subunit